MLKALSIPLLLSAVLSVVLAAGAVAAAPGVYLAIEVECKTDEGKRAFDGCAADCKAESDKRQARCNEAYRGCRADCAKSDRACRARCRTAYRKCSEAQRTKLKACRKDCLETHDCRLIPAQ